MALGAEITEGHHQPIVVRAEQPHAQDRAHRSLRRREVRLALFAARRHLDVGLGAEGTKAKLHVGVLTDGRLDGVLQAALPKADGLERTPRHVRPALVDARSDAVLHQPLDLPRHPRKQEHLRAVKLGGEPRRGPDRVLEDLSDRRDPGLPFVVGGHGATEALELRADVGEHRLVQAQLASQRLRQRLEGEIVARGAEAPRADHQIAAPRCKLCLAIFMDSAALEMLPLCSAMTFET